MTGVQVENIQLDKKSIILDDGRDIPYGKIILTTGSHPFVPPIGGVNLPEVFTLRTAEDADKMLNMVQQSCKIIGIGGGIIVDNHLRTSQTDIFATGDVAEHNGIVYGAWAASQYQGEIAGLNAVGLETQFGGLPRSNTIKALGLDLTSIGKFMPEDGSYQVIEDETEDSYLEFVFRDGKMQGAILINHADLSTPTKHAIDTGKSFASILEENPTISDIIEPLG